MNHLEKDLEHIFISVGSLWEELRGKQLFITGGTGFFGSWILESLVWANDKLDLGVSATVLTRNQDSFKRKMPHIAGHPVIKFHAGDVRNFDFPEGNFPYVIHAAATSAVATFNNEDPLTKFDTVVEGTRRVMEFAAQHGAKKILYTSSGAVYGQQPADLARIPEEYPGAPNPADTKSAWGESKRAAEFICGYYSDKYGMEIKIARCFSFVGPYLPLDIHYAVGNFIRDALRGGPIQISGDGTPLRSYLYAADLMIWLWTILFNGESGRVYNVGSDKEITIAALANLVASSVRSPVEVKIAKSPNLDTPPERYVPSTDRAKKELGLAETIDLEEAIKRTIIFNSKEK